MWKRVPLYLLRRCCSRAAASQSTRFSACLHSSISRLLTTCCGEPEKYWWLNVQLCNETSCMQSRWSHVASGMVPFFNCQWMNSDLREHIQLEIGFIALLIPLIGKFLLIKQKWQVERDKQTESGYLQSSGTHLGYSSHRNAEIWFIYSSL